MNAAGRVGMDVDEDRIDEAVLALLWLTLHDGARAWKGHDWDALDRLHRKGFMLSPANKAKSVVLTEEGLHEAERLFEALFARRPGHARRGGGPTVATLPDLIGRRRRGRASG